MFYNSDWLTTLQYRQLVSLQLSLGFNMPIASILERREDSPVPFRTVHCNDLAANRP
jgi:hypothetical protein